MATVKDIFDRTIALLDEISPDTGNVDISSTAGFEARAPYLVDILQQEVARFGRYRKTTDITVTANTDDPTSAYVAVSLPDDVNYVEKVIVLVPPDNYYRKSFMIEEDAVYVTTMFEGVLRVTYIPELPAITSLDDVLVVDSICQVAMAWGLAKMFVAPEGNDVLTAFFTNEFEKQKMLLTQRKPASWERVSHTYNI